MSIDPLHIVLVRQVHSQWNFWVGQCTCGRETADRNRETVEEFMAECRRKAPTPGRPRGTE